ncbi:head-tail connector protein [uncultured Pseudosulfitobacter sp.]|uniref:head-tail connector protein n=1 Tax=uncultured Pseudosulfitobacter sp. TaxID=2854214 RepID=UPI0030DCFD42|tara:strand:- start:112 stop:711 length:600 start_codon:yes stop_codon:yes gene_type:complete
MMLIEETTVPDAGLPVDEFKAHLRLGTGFGAGSLQDEVLISFLRAAMAAVEARTGKILLQRGFIWSLSRWRDRDAAAFPVAPVVAVTSVEVVDRLGVRSAVPAAHYWLEQDGQRPQLRPVGTFLPAVPAAGSVVIGFDAGYGATWADVPADLRQAVLLLAAHYYEFRNETTLSEGCMPFGVSSLIERYRTFRVWSGGAA